MTKIIRSICVFTDKPSDSDTVKLEEIENKLIAEGYQIQTKRLCTKYTPISEIESATPKSVGYISIGKVSLAQLSGQLDDFLKSNRVTFNFDLTDEVITDRHIDFLFDVIAKRAEHTFNFSYSFNAPSSSPFFTTTNYEQNGFSLGLQSADLSEGCESLDEWFKNMSEVWSELIQIFGEDSEFLGIDSSIAPLFDNGSYIAFMKKLHTSFSSSVISDSYTRASNFIKTLNPKPVGLNGLMFPALEDSELAKEYDNGNFGIERNIFLSLHSGLGVDTYPIGINESPERIKNILKLTQSLSNKYSKPLSVRFVSDGVAKIGDRTKFENQYLKNVTIRPL